MYAALAMAGTYPSLERFVEAQAGAYAVALDELRSGRKRTHWVWFVLPQLRGLGRSPMAERFGLAGLDEARAYLAHPLLGPRLRDCITALLGHADAPIASILGEVDAVKLRSCLTLFALAAPREALFERGLQAFFCGALDDATLRLLARASSGPGSRAGGA